MKHARPHNHIRVINTRRGRKAVLVNPAINKKMTNKQYRKMLRKTSPFADADGDGVKNINDCRPFDKKKQGFFYFVDKNGGQKMTYPDRESAEKVRRMYGEQGEGVSDIEED